MDFTGERFIPNRGLDNELEIEHFQRYKAVCNLVKGKIVLDAACGEGYGSHILSQVAKQTFGVDISQETIDHATNQYKSDTLSFINASICKLPFEDKSIDIVVSFETIEH